MENLDFKDDYFIYLYRGSSLKALYTDIISIESDKPYVKFYLKETKFSVTGSLVEVEKKLEKWFVEINRKVVVNMKNAKKINCKSNRYWIHMIDESEYLISCRRENEVRAAYLLYV